MLSQLLLTSFLRNPLIDVWGVYLLQIASLIAFRPFVVECFWQDGTNNTCEDAQYSLHNT
jgi:hypothetical protein